MHAGIVVFPGTNCEIDTKNALEYLGHSAELVWHDDLKWDKYDAIFLPGGFSFGDYVAAGRLAKFSPAIDSVFKFVEAQRGVVVGICNGFQILCETKLLPGALMSNFNNRFICAQTPLVFQGHSELSLPIAHKEGCFYAAESDIEKIQKENMIFLKYKNNPNASMMDIAGLYDSKTRVMGLMPHPERAVLPKTSSGEGKIIFNYIENISKESGCLCK